MLIYLDMCCLKRPFDDQTQARIRLEAEAVLALLTVESDQFRFVRSPALILENSRNPIKERASRVAQWLTMEPSFDPDPVALQKRTAELMQLGFKNFDAIHVACAEAGAANILVSCDDRLLATARRNRERLKVRVVDVVELAKEILT
ncbi:MAG TPA: hypothetical protein VIL86_16740 [Tepidisphaeraceae bacterium]|jgi:hypothetical protein